MVVLYIVYYSSSTGKKYNIIFHFPDITILNKQIHSFLNGYSYIHVEYTKFAYEYYTYNIAYSHS